jgi:GCN5-related N-acetyltransferase like domain
LSGLNASHPEITRASAGCDRAPADGAGSVNGETFSCGGWTAAAAGGDGWLAVSGSGAWLDGLRALCAAAWSAGRPPGNEQEQRRTAEAVLTAVEPAR